MDSASGFEWRELLTSNNAHMDQQEEQIMATGHAVEALVAQVSEVTAQLWQLRTETAGAPPSVSLPLERVDQHMEPRLPPPAHYSSEPQSC